LILSVITTLLKENIWLVVLTIWKNISQREGLSHILWKKNVPNHQPNIVCEIENTEHNRLDFSTSPWKSCKLAGVFLPFFRTNTTRGITKIDFDKLAAQLVFQNLGKKPFKSSSETFCPTLHESQYQCQTQKHRSCSSLLITQIYTIMLNVRKKKRCPSHG
jgi:hypothetical protein